MGKLRIIDCPTIASIQDFGRFGARRYGVPQSGAMDRESMCLANRAVGNPDAFPVVEFALRGMKLEVLAKSVIGWVGADASVNGRPFSSGVAELSKGDILEIGQPSRVYGYLSLGGLVGARSDFASYSTYEPASFGGINGRNLVANDLLESQGKGKPLENDWSVEVKVGPTQIRVMRAPETGTLITNLNDQLFTVSTTSNRMGIRLEGERLKSEIQEITSSAVLPGIIQLPADGKPIVLMHDCQTIGGYPRIGKVLDEDLGRLAQVKPGQQLQFQTI